MKGILRCPYCHSYDVKWEADEMEVSQSIIEWLTLPAGCTVCYAEWVAYLVAADIRQVNQEDD